MPREIPSIQDTIVGTQQELLAELVALKKALQELEVSPQVSVTAPEQDNSELLEAFSGAIEALKAQKPVEIPPIPSSVSLSDEDKGTLGSLIESINSLITEVNKESKAGKGRLMWARGGGNSQIRNIAGDKINPATEETLNEIADRGDYEIFGSQIVSMQKDFISIAFDSSAVVDTFLIDQSSNGGTLSVTSNNLVVSSGTAANGDAKTRSKSEIIYTPGHEASAKFTAVFSATTAGATQRIGFFTDNNGAYIEDNGTEFRVVHKRGGSIASEIAEADWNGDLATEYTKAGSVVSFDQTTGRVYRIRFGYLGYAGIIYEVLSPDKRWIKIHTIYYDTETVPLFTEIHLPIAAQVIKTSGSTDVTLKSGSWQGLVTGEASDPRVSQENSTYAALSAGAAFTGDWVNLEGYNGVELMVATDQVSASEGIEIQFSERGDSGATVRTTRFATFNAQNVTDGFKTVIAESRLAFVRIKYTNGGVDQGSMFMELRLHLDPLELPRGDLEGNVTAANTALMSRNLLFAKNDAGNYGNILRGDSGGLRVSVNEHEVETPIKPLGNYQTNQANVGTVAVQVAGTPLTDRKTVLVKNLSTSTKTVFIGNSSAVTSSNGYELNAGEAVEMELSDSSDQIWAIASSGTQRVCWLEIGT